MIELRKLDPVPPQLTPDPKDANASALKDHDPRMAVYAIGIDVDNGEKMTAYLVNGEWIRNNVWQDFTSGGNHERYNWIPPEEYFLDVDNKKEYDVNLIHETTEDLEMRDAHLKYNPAHSEFANSYEFEGRHEDGQTIMILRYLGWKV